MKFSLAVLGACLGLTLASPVDGLDLELEARTSSKYCKYSNKVCCKYTDHDYETHDYRNSYNAYGRRTIYVKKHKSIQKAIKSARKGDRIVVAAGTYEQQVIIDKDGIELVGKGATIVPPKPPKDNACSGLSGPGTHVGICVLGHGVKLDKFIKEHQTVSYVKRYVEGVSITGFTVAGFPGINIAVVGGKHTVVSKNTLRDAANYGGLTVGSVNTLFKENQLKTSENIGPIGICMDNKSGVTILKNTVTNYVIGLCVQTDKADIRYNILQNNCWGIFVDPGTDGAVLRHNKITGTNKDICPFFKTNTGIAIDGATNTKILDNYIAKQSLKGFEQVAGVAIVDEPCNQPPDQLSLACIRLGRASPATGTVVLRNKFKENDFDIFVGTAAKQKVIACNDCAKPAELCKA